MEVIKYMRHSGGLSNPCSEVCYYIPDKSLVLVLKNLVHPSSNLKIEGESHRRSGKVPIYSRSGDTKYSISRIEDFDFEVSELEGIVSEFEGIIRQAEEVDSLKSKLVEDYKNLDSALSQAEKAKVEET